MKRVIVDTGPLVAYFDRDSEFRGWARERFQELADPLISCQPVLTLDSDFRIYQKNGRQLIPVISP